MSVPSLIKMAAHIRKVRKTPALSDSHLEEVEKELEAGFITFQEVSSRLYASPSPKDEKFQRCPHTRKCFPY